MNRLEQARDIVRRHPLPPGPETSFYDGTGSRDAAELTADVLARSLHYVVELKTTPVRDESSVPLGASKYCGLPHLPPGFDWPAGQYFLAQLNLAEFHPYDLPDVFPDHGTAYIFVAMSTLDVTVAHYGGPADELRVTPYPPDSTFPDARYYIKGFRDEPELLRFEPTGYFYTGGDIYDRSDIRELLPPELVEQVSTALGAPVRWHSSGFNLFGRPVYFQGEDELMDEEFEFLEEDGETVVLGSGDGPADEPPIMLFQDEIGDAAVHVWISPADARKRNYAGCWSDGSCT